MQSIERAWLVLLLYVLEKMIIEQGLFQAPKILQNMKMQGFDCLRYDLLSTLPFHPRSIAIDDLLGKLFSKHVYHKSSQIRPESARIILISGLTNSCLGMTRRKQGKCRRVHDTERLDSIHSSLRVNDGI